MAGLLSPWPFGPLKSGFVKASSASSAPSGQEGTDAAGLLSPRLFGSPKSVFSNASSASSAPSRQQSDRQTAQPTTRTWGVFQPTQAPQRFALGSPRQTAGADSPTAVAALDETRLQKQAELDAANRKFDAANRAKLRGPVEVKQLSWEEYDALSPKQRAAVDFNGALYNATNADKQAQLKGSDDPNVRGSYNAALAKTFGSQDSGSDTYAPNTLALLSTLGLNDEGGDLDEWLDMGGAVTAGDLESAGVGMGVLTPEAQSALPLGQRTAFQLSNRTSNRLNDVLAKGQNLLSASAQQATAWGAVNADQLSSASSAFTSGDQKAQDFSDLFDSAISTNVGYTTDANGNATLNPDARNLVASSLEEYNYDPNEFRDYMIARLRNYQQQDALTPGISISSDLTSSSLSLPEIRRLYFPEE